MKHPIVILGGGLAGLTAARYLRSHQVPFRLFEAGPKLAGLAQSFHDKDGFTYDFGAHFITTRLAAAVGYSANCRNVPRYGESVWLRHKVARYPFGLLAQPRYMLSALASKFKGLLNRHPATNVADWFREAYGDNLAREIAIPLTEAWSGLPGNELSPAVGNKMTSGILRTIMLRMAGSWTKRTVAVGYATTLQESPHVWHVYPNGGLGAMLGHMARDVMDSVQTSSPVQKIYVEQERVVGVRVNEQDIPCSTVISTAPVHVLPKLVSGTTTLDDLAQFKYRAMIFVNLRLNGRGLLPDVVLWTPEKHLPYFRLTETPLSMPWSAPEGSTLLTVDIGSKVGDGHWTMSDDELGNYCVDHLQELIPDIRSRYRGCRVLRTPLAYPIYSLEYEQRRQQFAQSSGIDGLHSVGRNGEFAHILMEDVYWRTRRKLQQVVQHQ
ncbi:MAG: FAD-dependent oxidoreductase [Zavarzinella sp.]